MTMQYFLDIWLEAVNSAKAITMKYRGKSSEDLEMTTKLDDLRFVADHQKSPVTRVDKTTEQQMKAIIRTAFPEHWFIWEEEWEENNTADYKRIIDPIDGTRNYVRGLPYRAILLALSYKDEIIIAIVCIPVFDQIIWATKGGGTRINGQQVTVSTKTLSEAYLVHNRHTYFADTGKEQQFAELCKKVRYTKSCISREMVYVATGWFDVAINIWGNYYDNAPIKLLVEEAGGKVTSFLWGVFGKNEVGMIVSNGLIHDEVISCLQ